MDGLVRAVKHLVQKDLQSFTSSGPCAVDVVSVGGCHIHFKINCVLCHPVHLTFNGDVVLCEKKKCHGLNLRAKYTEV
jgi:hypothetical protein